MINVLFVMRRIFRQFSTNNVKSNISRENRYINKFINKYKSKGDPLDFSNPAIFGPTKKRVSLHVERRVNVLNNIFMQHITDLLSTGEIEPEILKRNIEISHVEVSRNFKFLNIFWLDNDEDIKPDTPELLKKCSYKLRHELCQLHIIGKIPAVHFVKCRGIGEVKEVEQKLKTLDFGEDYVPSTYPYATKHTVTAKTFPNTEEKVNKNENSEDTNDIFSVTLPEMRHDVFNLNHHKIMSKIKTALNKPHVTLKKHVINTHPSSPLSKLDLQDKPNFLTSVEQQEEFSKFLVKRRKEQRYINKQKYSRRRNIYGEDEEIEEDYDYDDDDDDDDGEYDEYEEEPDYQYYDKNNTRDIHNIDNGYKDCAHRDTENKH
ncbi:uncharacterized protein LOC100879153 [Megachile rotundata]|uniref:uncharacterized protein LOC100879153 n=1 Tax=Megachile rotundata TaxID=143995 RepID=UPI000615322B|nr:PREDICTED: uncharacterized protein LOC100879153 [Megachile rotundata]